MKRPPGPVISKSDNTPVGIDQSPSEPVAPVRSHCRARGGARSIVGKSRLIARPRAWIWRRGDWRGPSRKRLLQRVFVECAFPARYDNRCDRIADEIGQRPAFTHEAVDAQVKAMPAIGTEGTTESVAASVINPEPVMPAAPFELSIATSKSAI